MAVLWVKIAQKFIPRVLLNLAHALHLLCICLCVSVNKISQIYFIFGGRLPSDPGRKPSDSEKNRPGVRVGRGGGRNLVLMIGDRRKFF